MGNSIGYDLNSLIELNTVKGLVGVETATGYWGLSTFNTCRVILLFEDNELDNSGYFSDSSLCALYVPNINTENTVKLNDNLYITDKEQTVIDMIRYNRHEFHLYETIQSVFDYGDIDMNKLIRLAEQYNIKDRLFELKELAEEAYEEDNQ